jgi:hypothetical protein
MKGRPASSKRHRCLIIRIRPGLHLLTGQSPLQRDEDARNTES